MKSYERTKSDDLQFLLMKIKNEGSKWNQTQIVPVCSKLLSIFSFMALIIVKLMFCFM